MPIGRVARHSVNYDSPKRRVPLPTPSTSMPTPSGPRIRDLSREECEAILARNNVGRIAYAHAARVDIEPINYVFADGWIYCRTSRGAKVAIIEHPPWVAFEVDEVDALFDWRSVVVRGGAHFLDSG